MLSCVATIQDATILILNCNQYPIFLTTKCGPAQHHCYLIAVFHTHGGGADLWNMEMELSATCVFTCWMLRDGCYNLDGRKELHLQVEFMSIKIRNLISRIHRLLYLSTTV